MIDYQNSIEVGTLHFDDETAACLDRVAGSAGVSVAELIRRSIITTFKPLCGATVDVDDRIPGLTYD